nr:flagellar hook-length control protein FliK [Alkalibacter mobilis]
MVEGEKTTMKVNLHPKELGEMEITLSLEDGKLAGKILVENKEIRQVFIERLSELNHNFKENNLDVAKIEINVGAGHDQSQGKRKEQGRYNTKRSFKSYEVPSLTLEGSIGPETKYLKGIDLLA